MRVLFYKSAFPFVLLFLFSKAFSQLTLPRMIDIAPLPPNVASLGKYGSYPVNHSTGLINISIPVYEIKTPRLSVPITLSYHSSGIRVNDVSTWAGLGWSIISGGNITRSIMGKIDEYTDGYLSSSSYQEIKDVGQSSFDKTKQATQDYLYSMEFMQRDAEPDIFSYNFAGSAGRFVYNKDKTTLVRIPFDKSIVNLDFANNTITITETDGTVYRFGKALDGTNYTESSEYSNTGTETTTSAPVNWPLTAIISADKKDTIQFKYTPGGGGYIEDKVERIVIYSEHQGAGSSMQTGFQSSTLKDLNNTTGQILSEIIFRNGKVIFETQQDRTDITNSKRLNAVKVYSTDPSDGSSYVHQQTIQFYQSYFSGGERMRLDSVGFTAPGASQSQVYRFAYNTTTLPTRLSYARDYWGYYNGATGNTSLIPPISIPEGAGYLTYNTSINREVSFEYAKAASLEKITYPTGGYTEFEYEANKYLEGATSKTAGGLRIRQTRSYDGINPVPVKKTYVYSDGNISLGPKNCYSNLVSYYKLIVEWAIGSMELCTYAPESVKVNSFTSSPSTSLTNYDGNIVFYTDITEYEGEPSYHQGWTTYRYDYIGDNIVSYAFPNKIYKEINTWKRGQLLQQTVFNKNGYPVSSLTNVYSNIIDTLFTIQGILVGRVYSLHPNSCLIGPNCSDCAPPAYQNQYSFTNYSIRSGLKKLLQSVSIAYDQNDPSKSSTVTTDYIYDNSSYAPAMVTATSNNASEKLVTKFLYPGNYAVDPNSTDEVSKGIKLLKDNNMLTVPVETYQQRKASDNSLRTIRGVFSTYRSDLPVPSSAYVLDLTAPVTNFNASYVSGSTITKDSRYRLSVSFDQYDAAGNITEQSKASDVKQSFIWGYKSVYPVAQVTGATYNNILATPNLNLEVLRIPSSDQALREELHKIRQYLTGALVTTYTYKPLIGITSTTDANNRTSYYEYDEMGRLKLIKDQDGNIVKTVEYKIK